MFGSLSDFPYCDTPSHSLAELRPTSRLSTGLRGNVSTPLDSYLYTRQQPATWRRKHYNMKLPLSTLATQPVAEPGHSGGCFNASGSLQTVPLPSLSSCLQRGKRNVPIRSERYIPDPFGMQLPLPSSERPRGETMQIVRMNNSLDNLQQSRSRIASRSARHRVDCNFFLNGSSAGLHRRGILSQENVDKQLQYYMEATLSAPAGGTTAPMHSPTENIGLYYGKVSGLSDQKPQTTALKHLREMINETRGKRLSSSENKTRQKGQKDISNKSIFLTQT